METLPEVQPPPISGAFLVRCPRCNHVWPAAHTPIDARALGRLTPRGCPRCGGPSTGIMVATKSDLPAYAQYLRAELERIEAEIAA